MTAEELLTILLETKPFDVASVLMATGFVSSKNEARRMVKQGAVKVCGRKITDPHALIYFWNGIAMIVQDDGKDMNIITDGGIVETKM